MIRRPVLIVPLLLSLTGCYQGASYETGAATLMAAESGNPCHVVRDADVAALLREPGAMGTPVADSGLTGSEIVQVCTYSVADPAAPVLVLQTTTTDDYELTVTLLGSTADSVEPVEVAGAEAASLVVEREGEFDHHTVIALARGRLHIAIANADSPREATRIAIGAAALLTDG